MNQRNTLNLATLIFSSLVWLSSGFAAEKLPPLPKHSELLTIGERKIHINQRGNTSTPQAIVLLSGPNDYWHSDSAWFSLLLPELSANHRVIAIDRAGNAWSDVFTAESNYVQFADDLHLALDALNVHTVTFVVFASGNLTLHHYMSKYGQLRRVKGAVLIDPDVLTDNGVEFYSSGVPQSWITYNQEWNYYIAEGHYTERTKTFIKAEKEHVKTILSNVEKKAIDWSYFTSVLKTRKAISRQQNKVNQVSVYQTDLETSAEHPLPSTLPLVIINTDFETGYLESIDDQEQRETIIRWRDDGTEWYQSLVDHADCGFHIPLTTQDHIAPLFNVELIESSLQLIH